MAEIKQKIVPHLWFNTEAREASDFYCSVFPDSRVTNINTLRNTPSGDTDIFGQAIYVPGDKPGVLLWNAG